MTSTQTTELLSLPAALPASENTQQNAFCQLKYLATPPHGAPCSHAAARGLGLCIDTALKTLESPNYAAQQILSGFNALESRLKSLLETNGRTEILSALDGTKTRNPEWHFCAHTGSTKKVHLLATLYVGLKSLQAIHNNKQLTNSTIAVAKQLLKEEDLSQIQIKALLHGTTPEEVLGQSWPRDLCRAWREVLRHFSTSEVPPPPSPNERIAGQMLDAALHATASRRAGARSHRQLSKSQLSNALDRIGREVAQDSIVGALGTIACITTFSVDVVAEIRISSNSIDPNWYVQLDVESGILIVDYAFINKDASTPIRGAIPSSYICPRPLPKTLVSNLRARFAKYPNANVLSELFPADTIPAPDRAIYPCTDQIQPTWARLRRVIGTWLREAGVDNLLSSVASGDFTHVPRSKMYYACIARDEITRAFEIFYELAGWSAPVEIPETTLAFGCQVVPTYESLISLDIYWREKVKFSEPGKRYSRETLFIHHNNFTCWTAMRLSLLLALREASELSIHADIDEQQDRWIPIHDKNIPGDQGALPVPLTDWVKWTIHSVRAHCKALHSRLKICGLPYSDLARWCSAVTHKKAVPLLCVAEQATVRAIATFDFLSSEELKQLIPPDFGRKSLENLLRVHGLRASEIDAFLRHSMRGQVTNCGTSDTSSSMRWKRANNAITKIASTIFVDVGYGLAKE